MTEVDFGRLPVPVEVETEALREAIDLWGLCGLVSGQDGDIVGFALLTAVAPRARPDGRVARPGEVAALSGVWVDPRHRGGGLGRQFVQAAAAELVRRQVVAIEAVGHRSGRPGQTSGGPNGHHGGDGHARSTDLPVEFLQAVGFRIVQPHPTAPRLRMELTTAVRWRPDLGAAWQRLTGLVSKPVPPQPAGFHQHRQAEDAVAHS